MLNFPLLQQSRQSPRQSSAIIYMCVKTSKANLGKCVRRKERKEKRNTRMLIIRGMRVYRHL